MRSALAFTPGAVGSLGRVLSRKEHPLSDEEENWSVFFAPWCLSLLRPDLSFLFSLQIVYAERPLTDNHRSLASYGLKDGDVVILRQKETTDSRPPGQFPSKTSQSGLASPDTHTPESVAEWVRVWG